MKAWYESKTIWFNIFSTLAGSLVVVSEVMPEPIKVYVIVALGVVNVVLRVWFTNEPIRR